MMNFSTKIQDALRTIQAEVPKFSDSTSAILDSILTQGLTQMVIKANAKAIICSQLGPFSDEVILLSPAENSDTISGVILKSAGGLFIHYTIGKRGAISVAKQDRITKALRVHHPEVFSTLSEWQRKVLMCWCSFEVLPSKGKEAHQIVNHKPQCTCGINSHIILNLRRSGDDNIIILPNEDLYVKIANKGAK